MGVRIGALRPCSGGLGWPVVTVGARRERCSVVTPHPAVDGAGSAAVPLAELAAAQKIVAPASWFRELAGVSPLSAPAALPR